MFDHRGSRVESTRPRRGARSDLGSAMLVVMAAAAILFVIAASVVGVVIFQQTQQNTANAVSRATALAQQGMEVYLTELRTDYQYYETTPTIQGVATEGTWTVAATPTAGADVIVTAVGHDRASGMMHVIRAQVGQDSFSNYTIVAGGSLTLGNLSANNVTVTGNVLVNGYLNLRRKFTGLNAYIGVGGGVMSPSENASQTRSTAPANFDVMGQFPILYGAAKSRDPWGAGSTVTGLTGTTLEQSLAFYRLASNPSSNYWGADPDHVSGPLAGGTGVSNGSTKGSENDLVGVGVDFSNGSDAGTGLFYIRSVWPPSQYNPAASRSDFIALAQKYPTWNIGDINSRTYVDPTTGRERSYQITPRALNPNGNNVIYVGGDLDVYVKGTYSRSVTIVSERNIYIIGNVQRSAGSTATLGLVAKGDIVICGNMADNPATPNLPSGFTASTGNRMKTEYLPKTQDMTIQAAMMAVNGSIRMDPPDTASQASLPDKRTGTLRITGSLITHGDLSGRNFANDYSANTCGFANTVISFDSQLESSPPPLFPQVALPTIKVLRWDEFTTNVDPNADLTFPPPVATGGESNVPAGGDVLVVDPGNAWDKTPPVTVDNKMPVYYGSAVISLSAKDNQGSGVWKTFYTYDGTSTVFVGDTIVLPSPPANTVVDRIVKYWSEDLAGQSEDTKTITFRMYGPDTQPPLTTVTDMANPTKSLPDGYPDKQKSPADPDYLVYGDFNAQFQSVDTSTGMGAYWIWVEMDGDPTTVQKWDQASTLPLKMTVTAPLAGFATHTFQYYGIDQVGNREPVKTLTIKQHAPDSVAPITLFDVTSPYFGDAVIHLTGVDNAEGQGWKDTWYQVDDTTPTLSTSNPTTLTVLAPTNGVGAVHTLSFYSRDLSQSGNQEDTQTVEFTILPLPTNDTTPPVTTSDINSPYAGPAVITLTSYDEGGVAAVYWSLDGSATQTGTHIVVKSPLTGSDVHALSYYAVDRAGNHETAKMERFTVTPERIAPTTAAHNDPLYAGPAVFQLTAQDNDGGSGLANTYYKVDNGAVATNTPLAGMSWATVTGEGLHTVYFWSTDFAGNVEATKTTTLRIDTIPPVTSNDSTGTYVGQAVVHLTSTDVGGSGVKAIHWMNEAKGFDQSTNPILVGPGHTKIDYWAEDLAGNAEAVKSFEVTVTPGVDTSAPVSYDDVSPYYNAADSPAIISLYSWDVQSGVRTMHYILDGIERSFPGVGDPPENYQFTASGESSHTLQYWAEDKAGQVEATITKTFRIDTILPVTTCSARNNGTYFFAQSFSLTAVDTGSGIDSTYYSLDGAVPVKGTNIPVATPTDGSSHQHVIQYWSVDKAGNVEHPAKSVAFLMKPSDLIPPTTFASIISTATDSVSLYLSATDNPGGSGVRFTYYSIDGGPAVQSKFVTVTSGVHSLQYWSDDNAGNTETPKTYSSALDWWPPRTSPDYLPWYRGPATITLIAQDNAGGSGIAGMFYRVDHGDTIAATTTPICYVTVSGAGMHSLDYWSVDAFHNREATETISFGIDMVAPTTSTSAQGSYSGTSTITLIPLDNPGGSGVAHTYYTIDGGSQMTGTSVLASAPSSGSRSHTIVYWSDDVAGNIEAPNSVTFQVTALANMTFSGMVPTPDTTSQVRNPAVSVTAQADQAITNATGTIDGIPMPTTMTHPTSSPPATGGVGTQSFGFTGYDQTFVVPAGVTTIAVDTYGAQGGQGYRGAPGSGGRVQAVMNVTPGTIYTVRVGGAGTGDDSSPQASAGGWPNGGSGDAEDGDGGGGGGGSSSILQNGTVLLEAGAGGGSGHSSSSPNGLAGGTQSGASGSGNAVGGSDPSDGYGGGGGGGWTAGLSGSGRGSMWGGGGGTSHVSASVVGTPVYTGANTSGNGRTTITYNNKGAATAAGFRYTAGDQSFTVPAGVTSIVVDLYAGNGGVGYNADGGPGGWVHATIPVTPGWVLTFKVGGSGNGAVPAYGGGYGGGMTGVDSGCVGAGGGSTSVNHGTTILAEAGGGGGGGDWGSVGGLGGAPGSGAQDANHGNRPGQTATTGGGGGWTGGSASNSREPGGAMGGTSYIAVAPDPQNRMVAGVNAGDGYALVGYTDPAAAATTFYANSAVQTFIVPAGVTQLTADLYGSAGGNGGGAGGFVHSAIPVTPGEVLTVRVGDSGGWPNGGAGTSSGGAGGGSTSILRGSTILAESGGGGGTASGSGNGNGTAGGDPGSGAQDASHGNQTGTNGYGYGAGGGGGWNAGGNGNGDDTSGSGGTSLVPGGVGSMTAGANPGNGLAVISCASGSGGSNNNQATASFVASGLSNGPHVASFSFTNAAGASATKTWTFFVNAPADVTAPVTMGSTVNSYYSGATTITLSASDEVGGSGVANTTYRLDSIQTTSTATTTTVGVSAQGQHTLQYWSTDRSGNKEATHTVSFWIDWTAPTTTSDAQSSYAGTATVNLTATDPGGSGVKTTYYSVDGVAQSPQTYTVMATPSVTTSGSAWQIAWSGGTGPYGVMVGGSCVATVSSPVYYYAPLPGYYMVYIRDTTGMSSVAVPVVQASPPPPGGAHSASFGFVGADQTFQVPAGVATISVDLAGAPGADGWSGNGGGGGMAHTVFSVTPGQTYTIRVGSRGIDQGDGGGAGGWPNGGAGACDWEEGGGGGGGSTSILLGSTVYTEAGGGGGGGDSVSCDAGGAQGWLPGGNRSGTNGTNYDGGGGGGGWNGGIGGDSSSGGGGGTSYVAIGTGNINGAGSSGVGSVVINYTSTSTGNLTAPTITPATGGGYQLSWTGGTAPYGVVVDGSVAATVTSPTYLFNPPAAGTYSIVVRDSAGSSANAVTIAHAGTVGGVLQIGTKITINPPASGTGVQHTILYWSIDNASNLETTRSATFTVTRPTDTTPPTTTPTDLAVVYSRPSYIHMNAVDNPGGWGVANTFSILDGGTTTTGTTVYTGLAGPHTLQYWSVDSAGNKETTNTAYYTVNADSTPPQTTSNAIASYVGTANISLTATDPVDGWGVVNTYYQLDGGAITTGTAPVTSVSVLPPVGDPVGHTLNFWSVDAAGNREQTETASFTVEGPPAPVTWSGLLPAETGWTNQAVAAVSVHGVPTVSTVTSVTATVDGTAYAPNVVGLGSASATATFNTTSLISGSHRVAITFRLANGTRSTRQWVFNTDLVPPTTYAGVQAAYTGTATIYLTPTDNFGGSGVNATYYMLDGVGGGYAVVTTPSVTASGTGYALAWTGGTGPYGVIVGDRATGASCVATVTSLAYVYTPANPGLYWVSVRDSAGYYSGSTTVWKAPADQTSGSQTTVSYSSGTNVWTVPAGVTQITVTALGAGGGGGSQDNGGNAVAGTSGDKVVSTVSVTPGQQLTAAIGAGGTGGGQYSEGGCPGGFGYTYGLYGSDGDGTSEDYDWAYGGAGGGGSSGLRTSTTRLVEAKGGAGGKSSDWIDDDTWYGGTGGAGGGTDYPSLTTAYGGGAGGPVSAATGGAGSLSITYTSGASYPSSFTITPSGNLYVLGWTGGTAPFSVYVNGSLWASSVASGYVYSPSSAGTYEVFIRGAGGDSTHAFIAHTTTRSATPYVGSASVGTTITVAPPAYADTTHTVQFWSRDNAGNIEATKSATFLVKRSNPSTDVTPPSGTMVVNGGAAYTNSVNAAVNSTVTDTYSGMATMSVDPGSGTFGAPVAYTTQNAQSFPITLPTGDGVKEVRGQFADKAGNVLTLYYPILLDTLAPATTSTAGASYVGTATLSLSATDTFPATGQGSGVSWTRYSVDNGVSTTYTSNATISVSPPAAGSSVNAELGATLLGGGFESGVNGVSLGSPWTVGSGGTALYSNKTPAVGSMCTQINTTSNTTAAVVTESSSAGMNTNGAEYRFWFNPPNSPSHYSYIMDNNWASPAWMITIAPGTGGAMISTSKTGITGYPAGYSSVATIPAGWLEWRVVLNFTSQTYQLSYRASTGTPWTMCKSDAAPTYNVPFASTSTVTQTSGFALWNNARTQTQFLDNVEYSNSPIVDAPSGAVHHVDFKSADRAGNVEATETATFTVNAVSDILPPSTTATNLQRFYSAPATITLSAIDNAGGWGVAFTSWKLDSGPILSGTPPFGVGTGGSGQHTLLYWSTDLAGNREATNTATLNVDMTPPTTSSNATGTFSTLATITLTAVDNALGSGVKYTHYILDGGAETTYTSTFTVNGPGSGSTTHTLSFYSVDVVGNKEATQNASFKIMAPPDIWPPVSIANVQRWYRGNSAITISASDVGWGLASIRYIKTPPGGTVITSSTPVTIMTGAQPGDFQLTYWSTDLAGNTEASRTAPFGVDTTAPVTSSNVATSVGSATVSLPATDGVGPGTSGVAVTYYQLDNGGTQTYTAPFVVQGPTSGSTSHSLVYWSVDVAGNIEAHNTYSGGGSGGGGGGGGGFTIIANEAPLTFSAWTPVGTVSSRTQTIAITAASSGPAIVSAAIWVDGQPSTIATYTGQFTTLCTPSSIVSNLGDGVHTVQVTFTCNGGSIKSTSWTFTVNGPDNVPPVTTAVNPQASYYGTATISLTATDYPQPGGVGVNYTQYRIDSGSYVNGNATTTTVSVAPPAMAPPYTPAGHYLYYKSVDKLGNWETEKWIYFTVLPSRDTTAPRTTSDATTTPYVGSARISLTATDNVGGWGVRYTIYQIDHGQQVYYTGAPFNVPGPASLSATHTITFWSIDWAGNPESANGATITVKAYDDNTAPITTPVYSLFYPAPSTITLNAADNIGGWGVDKTFSSLDGALPAVVGTTPSTGGSGQHTLQFWSTDLFGNKETTRSISFNVDMTPPTTTSNAGPTYDGTATILLTATDTYSLPLGVGSGVNRTRYSIDDGAFATGTTVVVPPPVSNEATHHVDFYSVDNMGNQESTKTASFTVKALTDTTRPHTTCDALSLYGAQTTFNLIPTDVGWGVATTYYIRDGGVMATGTVVGTGAEGTHTVEYWSADKAGNVESPHEFVSYKVDLTAPITTSNAGTIYYGSASISLSATDGVGAGVSGVQYTSYTIDRGAEVRGTSISISGPTSGSPVPHRIDFWSVDFAGHAEDTKVATFTIAPPRDTTAPTTTATVLPFYPGVSTIALHPVDNVGGWGVDKTYSSLDGALPNIGVSPSTGGSGQHTLQFWSTDLAGNMETTKSVSYNVDMTPPTTTPNGQSSYTGNATITLNATDTYALPLGAGSGVKATYYTVDDGTQITSSTVVVPAPAFGNNVAHHIDFYSIDNMNNTETSKRFAFTVSALPDNIPPSTTPSYNATYSMPGTITLTANDNVGGWGVTNINYSIDGSPTVAGYANATGGNMSVSCQLGTRGGGTHTLKFWAVDKSGNGETTKTISYYVTPDTTAPVTTWLPGGNYFAGPMQVLLSATDGGWGVANTYAKIDGGATVATTAISFSSPTTGTVTHKVDFWSVDNAGNIETTKTTGTFTVDSIPAAITWSNMSPAPTATITTSSTVVSVTGVDVSRNIVGMTATIDGVAQTVTTNGMPGATVNGRFTATALASGSHTVIYVATDASGAQSTKSWTFNAQIRTDFTAPITYSDAKSFYYGVATVTLTPTDEVGGSGVNTTRYKIDSGSPITGTVISVPGPASGDPATHTVYFWSIDNAGNVEATKSATFRIAVADNTPPVTIISNAAVAYRAPGFIQLSATDAGSGVAATYSRLDGGAIVAGSMPGFAGTGRHVLEYWSVDNAGNVEATNTFTFKLDPTAPVTHSDAKTSYIGPAVITLTAEDEPGGSGLAHTYYRVDTGYSVDTGALSEGTTVTIDPPLYNSDQHTLYYWSVDVAGNVETTQSKSFSVAAPEDLTPPTTTTDAKSVYLVPGLITLTAHDNYGGWGVKTTYFRLDSETTSTGTAVRTGGVGTHTLRFWSDDKAGNTESVKSVTYSVTSLDTSPPVTSSDATSTYVGVARISLTATDNCGVPPVTFYRLDTGANTTGTLITVPAPRSGVETHTIYFWSTDINGNTETPKQKTFTSTVKPANMTFSGVTPADGSTSTVVRNPAISVSAQSATLTITGAILDVDGQVQTINPVLNGTSASVSVSAYALTNGLHRVTATFIDSLGQTSNKTWSFTVNAPNDTSAPSSTSDVKAAYAGSARVTISASDVASLSIDSGVRYIYYTVDGGAALTGSVPNTVLSVATVGTHRIEFWAVDNAGNEEWPHHIVNFTVDVTPPSTQSDAQSSYDSTAVIGLVATDTPTGSGVQTTYFKLDDNGTVQPLPAGSKIQVSPPDSTVVDGVWHTLYFWSVDVAGNVEPTQSVQFKSFPYEDVTKPHTTSNAAATYALPGYITLTPSDEAGGSGVAHTYYILDGGVQTEGLTVGTGGPGTHTLEFWSVDRALNEEVHNNISYVVSGNLDVLAPHTSSNAATSYPGVGTISLTASDGTGANASGVAHTYYTYDDGPRTESTIVGVSGGSGTHHIDFWSVDWAGNVEATQTATFVVVTPDVTPPTTRSDAAASYTGTATITLTPSDTGGSGVQATFYRIDNGPFTSGTTIVIAPPTTGSATHSIMFWSVDNVHNVEVENVVSFTVQRYADTIAPSTTTTAVASYNGTATIFLTATDNTGGSGVAHTFYRVDGHGSFVSGTSIVIGPPDSGSTPHNIQFYSTDNAGNIETTQTFGPFNVVAIPMATLRFYWYPPAFATAGLRVVDSNGVLVATKNLSGNGPAGALVWNVTVQAGKSYRMICDSWYNDADGSSRNDSFYQDTPILTFDQVYRWDY